MAGQFLVELVNFLVMLLTRLKQIKSVFLAIGLRKQQSFSIVSLKAANGCPFAQDQFPYKNGRKKIIFFCLQT